MGTRDELDEEHREVFDAMVRLGLSESAAFDAAVGRGGGHHAAGGGFDGLVGSFRSMGLTEDAARQAAVGRARSESEAREALAVPDVARGRAGLESTMRWIRENRYGGRAPSERKLLEDAIVHQHLTSGGVSSVATADRLAKAEMRAALERKPEARPGLVLLVEAALRTDGVTGL